MQDFVSYALAVSAVLSIFFWRNRPEMVLIIAGIYASIHYVGSSSSLLTGGMAPAGIGVRSAKLSGVTVLISIALACIPHCYKHFRNKHVPVKVCITSCIFMITGYMLNSNCENDLWLQDVLSSIAMLVYSVLLIGPALAADREHLEGRIVSIVPWLVAFLLISVMLAAYEVAYDRAWACFSNSDGEIVCRASAFFINPNFYGAWLVLICIFFLYSYDRKLATSKIIYMGLMLSGFGLFLSGSRGSLVAAIIIFSLMLARRSKDNYVGFFTMVASFLGGFNIMLFVSYFFCAPLRSLSKRWLSFPNELYAYAMQIFSPMPTPAPSAEFMFSVEGRFVGGLRDNGLLAVYDNGGILAVSGIVLFLLNWGIPLAVKTIRNYDVITIYSISLFIYILLWSVQARTLQVFPMWLFCSLIIAITTSASKLSYTINDHQRN